MAASSALSCPYCKGTTASVCKHVSAKHRALHRIMKARSVSAVLSEMGVSLEEVRSTAPHVADTFVELDGHGKNGCPYSCAHCSFLGYDPDEMTGHSRIAHPEVLYPPTCPYCQRGMKTRMQVVKHVSAAHREQHRQERMKVGGMDPVLTEKATPGAAAAAGVATKPPKKEPQTPKKEAKEEEEEEEVVVKKLMEDMADYDMLAQTGMERKDFGMMKACAYCKQLFRSKKLLVNHISAKHRGLHRLMKAQSVSAVLVEMGVSLEEVKSTAPRVADTFVMLDGNGKNGCAYSCAHCYYLGYDPDEMTGHSRIAHPEVLYPSTCPYCMKEMRTKKLVTNHISAVHREEHREKRLKVTGMEPALKEAGATKPPRTPKEPQAPKREAKKEEKVTATATMVPLLRKLEEEEEIADYDVLVQTGVERELKAEK